ncbi:MAG: hypothetical protein EOP54_32355, partial [Sphingobacteriales bacterium]
MMKRLLVLFAAATALFAACNKKYDEYYARPDDLESPIYQILESKGNFKHFLAAIDKAGYKNTLAAAGYWTIFAPHDSAFQVYFAANNLSGVEAMDAAKCRAIVTYSLVYNAFNQNRLDDYQSATGWVENAAFKRRTANYTGVYDAKNTAGADVKAIASNRNNNGAVHYVAADNNNKYIPYFMTSFMTGKSLTATDYNYFYPTTTYTGFNVVDAVVTERDIPAENGIIHVINKVVSALPSIDEYITSNPNYSEFKKVMDRFQVQFVTNPTVTNNYRIVTGSSAEVFTKVYASGLAFSPNNENFLKLADNDGQSDGDQLDR